MKKHELLKNMNIFSGLSKNNLKLLATLCKERIFEKGSILVKQGNCGLGLFIVVSGKLKIIKENERGDSFDMGSLGPGGFFGEITVLDNAPRSSSIIAVEDTECLVLISWDFNALAKLHPEIALELLPFVVKRFREANRKLLNLKNGKRDVFTGKNGLMLENEMGSFCKGVKFTGMVVGGP